MGFDCNILVPVLQDVFCRRPENVKNASGKSITVEAGHVAQWGAIGNWLEGDVKLYSSNNKVNVLDVQQHGSYENTSVSANVSAVADAGLIDTKADIYGYTWGQDGNQTAKFEVKEAINIEASEPEIKDVKTYLIDYRVPEAIQFVITATTDVKVIAFNLTDNVSVKNLRYTGTNFIYIFESSGPKTIYIQGITADNRCSNTIKVDLNIHTRPRVSYINVYPATAYYPLGSYMYPLQIAWMGYTSSKFPAYKANPICPMWRCVSASYSPASKKTGIYPVNVFIELGYDITTMNNPIYRINTLCNWYPGGQQHVLSNFQVLSVNRLLVQIQPVNTNQGLLSIFVTPFSTTETKGETMEIILDISPAAYYFQVDPQGKILNNPPKVSNGTWWDLFIPIPGIGSVIGTIIGTNDALNYGLTPAYIGPR